jgi:hypothetical protein
VLRDIRDRNTYATREFDLGSKITSHTIITDSEKTPEVEIDHRLLPAILGWERRIRPEKR